MAALNTRWTGDGLRRTPNSVQPPTRAAPTGPHSTTAASDAMLLADHDRPRGFTTVAEDSQATRRRPSAPTWTQSSPPNGPTAIMTTAAATTMQMYSHATRESLPTLPPRSLPELTRIAPIAVVTPRRPRKPSSGQSSLAECERPLRTRASLPG